MRQSKNFSWKIFFVFFAIALLLHIPFLNADPDRLVDVNTRGAWIDEGLYSFQARELIDSGSLDTTVNDAFIRSPIFQSLLVVFFFIFGTHFFAARLVTLLIATFVLAMFASRKKTRVFGLILSLIVFSQFHVFQFSHYSLVYIAAASWVLLAMLFFSESFELPKGLRNSLLASFFIFLAYGTTIQLVGASLLLPSASFILWLLSPSGQKRQRLMIFLYNTLFAVLFGLIYLIVWYLPYQEFFQTIVFFQTEGRFPSTFGEFFSVFQYNFTTTLWTKETIPYYILASLCLLSFPFLIRKSTRIEYSSILLFGVIWLLIEFPKTGMYYIPNRYLLSFIISMSVLSSLVLASLFDFGKIFKVVSIFALIAIFSFNMLYNFYSYQRRTFDIANLNTVFSNSVEPNMSVLGAWAPSFTWDSNVKCIPVWNNYMNFQKPIEKFNPKAIVTEFNQADNDHCYEQNGYQLFEIADSMRIFGVWRYNIAIYWLKSK